MQVKPVVDTQHGGGSAAEPGQPAHHLYISTNSLLSDLPIDLCAHMKRVRVCEVKGYPQIKIHIMVGKFVKNHTEGKYTRVPEKNLRCVAHLLSQDTGVLMVLGLFYGVLVCFISVLWCFK
ncbi:uncharacterized protein LOC123517600 [Portunus trituberculatus]|uniref:uncharacterized protein LOC123517600 n=1 Tax=Portunus trituberculatus TaxID=210409 RepID=UPI001E1CB132|nr:uncharacterized protein LOC123517600 [Portunus trituberculatus]